MIALEIGKQYKLTTSFGEFPAISIIALYAGCYDHRGSKSHRFVHVVKYEDYFQFIRTWVHRAQSVLLTKINELEEKTTIMHTDVFEDILLNHIVDVVPV